MGLATPTSTELEFDWVPAALLAKEVTQMSWCGSSSNVSSRWLEAHEVLGIMGDIFCEVVPTVRPLSRMSYSRRVGGRLGNDLCWEAWCC